jgi:small subunit ribosomal protein S16
MVVIRLARFGSKHNPQYRVTVADKRYAATGRFLEVVGNFNPSAEGKAVALDLKLDRINHWVKQGAQPTERVQVLIKKAQATK